MTVQKITILGVRHTVTETKQRCVIEATIEPLSPFPRGFARSKAGPFFDLRTVQSLIRAGALRIYHPVRGKSRILVTARAA